jgi:(p)ppGpp synthase/HD superfamily hydrolase
MTITIDPSIAQSTAYQIAMQAHSGQFRRDGVTPYFDHVAKVGMRVLELYPTGTHHTRAILWEVSLLHDVLEDSDLTATDLLKLGISREVVNSVVLLTKPPGQSYADYIEAIKSDRIAKKVKIADMLSNLSETPTKRQMLKYAQALTILLS